MAIGDSTRINTNIAAYNALNALKSVNRELEISQLRLATGKRINEVAEDPAGYTISKRLESRARGISVAIDNVGTAKNVLSIAEGGLTNISDILITIKEKVTQAASDTLGSTERNAIKTEIDQFISEIDNIVSETTFNNQTLIDGTFSGISVQTGEVLLTVSGTKTIASMREGVDVFRFIDMGTRAVEMESGVAQNEPVNYAVRSAIEHCVIEIINKGQRKGCERNSCCSISTG